MKRYKKIGQISDISLNRNNYMDNSYPPQSQYQGGVTPIDVNEGYTTNNINQFDSGDLNRGPNVSRNIRYYDRPSVMNDYPYQVPAYNSQIEYPLNVQNQYNQPHYAPQLNNQYSSGNSGITGVTDSLPRPPPQMYQIPPMY